jgi:hypothetical protein
MVVVDYFHYYLLIAVKMDQDHYLDLVINEENFVENNLIEIEDLTVQHDKQFVDSNENRFLKKLVCRKLFTDETSGEGEFCRRGDVCLTSPIGL